MFGSPKSKVFGGPVGFDLESAFGAPGPGDVKGHLQTQPVVRFGPSGLFQANRHFRRYASLTVDDARPRVGECIGRRSCEGITSHVARVDTPALTSREIFTYPTNNYLILGTVAIEVGDEVWVSGVAGGTRIARVPLP